MLGTASAAPYYHQITPVVRLRNALCNADTTPSVLRSVPVTATIAFPFGPVGGAFDASVPSLRDTRATTDLDLVLDSRLQRERAGSA